MQTFQSSPSEAVFYEDDKVYACLAYNPLAEGHCVVVWKENIEDLHLLKRADYEHLMWIVDKTRDALLAALDLSKVYLLYMDEAKHAHWHLVPRYEDKGFTVLTHQPSEISDFSLASKIKKYFKK